MPNIKYYELKPSSDQEAKISEPSSVADYPDAAILSEWARIRAKIEAETVSAIQVFDLSEADSATINGFTGLTLLLFTYNQNAYAFAYDSQSKKAVLYHPEGEASSQEYQDFSAVFHQKGYKDIESCVYKRSDSDSAYNLTAPQLLRYIRTGSIATAELTADHSDATAELTADHSDKSVAKLFLEMNFNNRAWGANLEPHSSDIMLADESFWQAFLSEGGINHQLRAFGLQGNDLNSSLKLALKKQKHFILGLKADWEKDEAAREKLRLICDFQTDLTLLILDPAARVDAITTMALKFILRFDGVAPEEEFAGPDDTADSEEDSYLPVSFHTWRASETLPSPLPNNPTQTGGVEFDRHFAQEPSPVAEVVPPTLVTSSSHSKTQNSGWRNFPKQHPYIWGLFKWLAIGACIATIIYFSGGLAALPTLGKLGALAIPAAMPVLAAGAAIVWYGCLKPLARCCGAFPPPKKTRENQLAGKSTVFILKESPKGSSHPDPDEEIKTRMAPPVASTKAPGKRVHFLLKTQSGVKVVFPTDTVTVGRVVALPPGAGYSPKSQH